MTDTAGNTDESPVSGNNRPAPGLIFFLIIPLMGILVALLMVAAEVIQPGGSTDPDAFSAAIGDVGGTLVNQPAPNFELFDLEGNIVRLEDYTGQVLFLNFWQTTCPPCVEELPAFVNFLENNAGAPVAVLAVNFDETSTQVRDFLASHDIVGLPVVLDPNSDVRRTYNVGGIPQTFVVDAEGVVRFWRVGEMTAADMQDYLRLVQETSPEV